MRHLRVLLLMFYTVGLNGISAVGAAQFFPLGLYPFSNFDGAFAISNDARLSVGSGYGPPRNEAGGFL